MKIRLKQLFSKITDSILTDVPADQKRWYAIKVFERDEKVLARLNLNESKMAEVEAIVSAVEKDLDDDAESIITNARYTFITEHLMVSIQSRMLVSSVFLIRLITSLQTVG